jgi:tRNA threonylcarbamoyladenosine biosynthesis protein TsaE
MSWPLQLTSRAVEDTRAVAARLATLCRPGDVVLLVGDLGAGKTAFAQGFAAALGVEGPVTSPTFALVRHYRCGAGSPVRTLIHADVYRTESVAEVADLALAELVEEDAVALVEWGDRAALAFDENALVVSLELPDPLGAPDVRVLEVVGHGTWTARADEVRTALARAPGGEAP